MVGDVPAKATPRRTSPARTPERAPWHASKYVRFGALGIVVVAAAVSLALVLGNGGNSPPAVTQVSVTPIWPVALTASELKARARDLNQVIYWVGPVTGDKYELTRTTTNDVYVRYLPHGVKVGAHQGKYLLVATYPFVGALAAVEASDNGHPLTVAGGKGAIAAVDGAKPTSVRVAFPDVDYQIELYDPSARKALRWATSAALTPVP
jgi:hypothetical protein